MTEAQFPTTFAAERHTLGLGDVAAKHSMPLAELSRRGYAVELGVMREDVPALTEIAEQPGTLEYCPNDLARRWTNEETTEKQLAKDGGRGVFLLRAVANNAIMGFGWTGKSSEEERSYLPMCENTFAVRLHQDTRGQGLAVPFTKMIVAGSMSVFRARRIGLETWASNNAAVNTYVKSGAVLVRAVTGTPRPTLNRHKRINEQGQYVVDDTRLYMNFPWSA